MPGRSRVFVAVTSVCCAVALAACSGSTNPRGTVTEYVDPSPPPSSSAAPSSSTSASAGISLPAAPASMTKLPGRCNGKLPLSKVAGTIGEQLKGKTAFVVGTPDASIHRVTYINCQYGLSGTGATPAVEIQVSLYHTSGQASGRIAPNVSDYQDHGATAHKTSVGSIPAEILTGGTGNGYDTATLVLAYGQRTVAVSLSSDIAADKQTEDLTKLAALAVARTQ